MNKAELLDKLKNTDTLLPQDILQGTSIGKLAEDLKDIFESHQTDLEVNPRFRNNFTELVNYIYLSTLRHQPQSRKKDIFSKRLISFLLTPHSAL